MPEPDAADQSDTAVPTEGLVSLAWVAERAGCCLETVRRAARAGQLPVVRVNARRIVVTESAAYKFIRSRWAVKADRTR
jgi:hypothetical protein